MTHKCCITLLVASTIAACTIGAHLAGSPIEGWSPEEQALAKQLGIDLTLRGIDFRYRAVAEQTWLAPWVVEGIVRALGKDPYGVYHTTVKFHVDKYLKGTGPADITLSYIEGEAYSEHYGRIVVVGSPVGAATVISSQDVGNRFVLFLDKASLAPHGNEAVYKRAENDFNVKSHYLLTKQCACPDAGVGDAEATPGTSALTEVQIVGEVLRVAVPQSRLGKTPSQKEIADGDSPFNGVPNGSGDQPETSASDEEPKADELIGAQERCRQECHEPVTFQVVVQDGRIGVQASDSKGMERRLLPLPRPEGPLAGVYHDLPEICLIALSHEQVVRDWEPLAADWLPGLWWLAGSSRRGQNLVLTQERADVLIASLARVQSHSSDHLFQSLEVLKQFIRSHIDQTVQQMAPELFADELPPPERRSN